MRWMKRLPFGNLSREARFWEWFVAHDDELYNLERDREGVFNRLSDALASVHPDLTFEFSPVFDHGKREFIISAGGLKVAFPAVQALHAQAPSLERWIIVPFRPRRWPIMNIEMAGVAVAADEAHASIEPDRGKVGIALYLPGYSRDQHNVFAQIGYLLLDEALGEFDVETKVGYIEFGSITSQADVERFPLAELPARFDALVEKIH
jgi:hypothetical protein